jgi:Ca2+:H+ antiporter
MSRWLYLLLIAAPLALILRAAGAGPLVVFIVAALGLVPLAGLIGLATEALAERVGPTIGGLLNATFGNAAEIIIGLAALAAGLPDVVRASLAGSIIGNSLLVLGTAMVVGGWRYRRQLFDARTAGQYASMLALVVVGLAIPSLLWTVGEGVGIGQVVVRGEEFHRLSIGVSVILLACYGAYIAYTVFGVRAHPDSIMRPAVAEPESDLEPDLDLIQDAENTVKTRVSESGNSKPHRSARSAGSTRMPRRSTYAAFSARFTELWHAGVWLPIAVLAAVTVTTAFVSEALVGTIEPLADQVGLNPFFVGLIVLPIVGNAAEHFTAITAASHDHMEIAMAITAGSSIQIALLATPVLVLAGAFMAAPLDLNFSLLEVAIFGFVAGLYALISLDGESTWLEGVLLAAFYLILAVGTFFAPT